MAFRLPVHLEGYEYRNMRTGQGQNGTWMSIVLENPADARQVDIRVPQDMQSDVYNMHLNKGYLLDLNVIAYAGADYSSVRLVEIVAVYDSDGEVQL